jgi:pyruvate dehydrogenase (quinone)
MDHQPVVAIVGQSSRLAMRGSYQQGVDLQNLFKDVASDYCQTAMAPGQMRHLIDRGFRIAQAQRSVTCILISNDLQEETYADPPHVPPSAAASRTANAKRCWPCCRSRARRTAPIRQSMRTCSTTYPA